MTAQMQGNPYIAHLETVATTDVEAQMNATLALAFEQRTANLIAFREMQDAAMRRGWPISDKMQKALDDLDERLLEGLGLK